MGIYLALRIGPICIERQEVHALFCLKRLNDLTCKTATRSFTRDSTGLKSDVSVAAGVPAC